jgi:hypothetical protein
MQTIKLNFSNGHSLLTAYAGSREDIEAEIGKVYKLETGMEKVLSVDFLVKGAI